MARGGKSTPQTGNKNRERPQRDPPAGPADVRNNLNKEKMANASEDDESQTNKYENAGKLLFPFRNSAGSQEEGAMILINEKEHSFETVKRYIGEEEFFNNALYGFEDTDPVRLGTLLAFYPASQIIALVVSCKTDRAIKLMSEIYGQISLCYSVQLTEELQGVLPYMIPASGGLWYTPSDCKAIKMANLYMPHMETAEEQPCPDQAISIIPKTREYKKRRGRSEEFKESSEEVLKNYTDSEESRGSVKNLYFCKSEVLEDKVEKNLIYVAEDSDFNNTRLLYPPSEDEDEDETLELYQNSRQILLLLSRKADEGAVAVLGVIDLMIDSKSRPKSLDTHSSEKYSAGNLIIDQKPGSWIDDSGDNLSGLMRNLKPKDLDVEEEFGGNTIDKNFPRMRSLRTKNSNGPFLEREGYRADERGGWSTLLPDPLAIADAKRNRIRSGLSSFLRCSGGGSTRGQELYSSLSEGSKRDYTDSSGDAEKNTDSEICSTTENSVQHESETFDEQCFAPAEDEKSADDKQQRGEETSEDALHSHRRRSSNENFLEDHTTVSQPETSQWASPIDSGESRSRRSIQKAGTEEEGESKRQISEDRTGSKQEHDRRDTATDSTDEDVEDNLPTGDLEADVTAACDGFCLTDSSTAPERLAAVEETLTFTPPLSTPVQVSSPPESESTFTAYPDDRFESRGNSFISTPCDEDDAVVYSRNFPSETLQLGSEHSPSAGACGGGHAPVVSENFCHHTTIDLEDESGPFVTEETTHSFPFQGARHRESSTHHAPPHPHFSDREKPPTQNAGHSESESQSNSAPLHLPPITVHAAGALPPGATRTARIDLSRAANREFAQLRERRATYDDDWPNHSGIDPANMALAGFFRPGRGRRALCFYCGLELDNLDSGHNVWNEHVRLNPRCPYLVAIMGLDK